MITNDPPSLFTFIQEPYECSHVKMIGQLTILKVRLSYKQLKKWNKPSKKQNKTKTIIANVYCIFSEGVVCFFNNSSMKYQKHKQASVD